MPFLALSEKPSILTTMDITTDGFGFMLVFGDYVWVPMTYSLQARYLAFNHVELGWGWISIIVGVNALGYYVFRSSNAEKNDFRNGNNPKGANILLPSLASTLTTGLVTLQD